MKSSTKNAMLAAACVAMVATAGCNKASAPPAQSSAAPVSEADATAAADASQAAWTSMDPAKIEAAYGKDIVGFDPIEAPISTTWANWDRLQHGFADMKFDQVIVPDRKIQTLDADNFVVSGTARFTSTDGKVKAMPMRFTDVYHRQPDGSWAIVNEHVSVVPAAQPAA
jgi:hypothetical protein